MGQRKERALNFMRGVGLPRATSNTMSDDSESDPGADLDGSSDNDEEMFVVGGTDVWLDDISIVREIGHGNFGSGFLATWHKATDVACKSVSGDDVESTVLEEAQQLHRLNHPNIVRFFGLYRDAKKSLFIVMEYLPKGALDVFLKTGEGRRLSSTSLLRICIDTATGMHYLSRKSVVHGDLGARNLLVVSVDDRIGVKIADFGLSLLCDRGVEEEAAEGEQYCRIPTSDNRKFPIRHTAPEIVDSGRYSSKSDVWSFGVVVWEVYSGGKRPYDGMSNTDVIQYLREGARLERPPACSERVYNIVLRCWHKTPIRRPRFGDIRSDLCEELGGDDGDGDGLQYNTISAVGDPWAENDYQTE
jgi:serine/threonine protein kinase